MECQWYPEFKVTSELAQLLIEEQFPKLPPLHMEPLGDGWDNTAFLVNKRYVFRFPRRQVAVELLETENLILPQIASFLPLPVPVPLFIGHPSVLFQWPFSGYSFIPGQTACKAGLTMMQRVKLAQSIAGFLKSLHTIPVEKVFGAGPDKIYRLDLTKRIPNLYRYLEDLRGKGFLNETGRITEFVRSLPADPPHGRLALVHGDFYLRHILVDSEENVTGIIDWGDFHTGNPAIDISIAAGFLPPEGRKIFRDVYGEIDEGTWSLARFKALYMAVILLSYGHDTGDYSLVREAHISLNMILNEETQEGTE